MPRIIVLGTGTGVGKTYVTVALARALAAAAPGGAIVAAKPIETGIRRTRLGAPPRGSDAAALEGASTGIALRPHPFYAFREPISPHLAARNEHRQISLSRLRRWSEAANRIGTTLHHMHWIIWETAGGAFSPLGPAVTNVDLATALGPAIWLLVAPDSLGVLHDLRATMLALAATARAPDYLVLSAARKPDAATGRNASELRRLGLPRPIAVVSRTSTPEQALAPLVRALLRRAAAEPRR